MAVKAKTEETVAEVNTENKNKTLIAVALGVAGLSLVLSAGGIVSNAFDRGFDGNRGPHFNQSQQGNQQGQGGRMHDRDGDRGGQFSQQDGMMNQQDGQLQRGQQGGFDTQNVPQGGMMSQQGGMKFNSATGAS